MGRLHVTQIQDRLGSTVAPYIDVSDLAGHPADEIVKARNSRALAAFVAMKMADLEPAAAAASVVDGPGDNGIDVVVALPDESRLIVIQSKWAEDSRGSVALDDLIKFRDGLDDLVQLKWDRFNSKMQGRVEDIQPLLLSPSIRIEIIFAHMGTGDITTDSRVKMDDFLDDLNDPTETATFVYFNQGRIHQLLIDESAHSRIDLVVELSDWGLVDGPPSAVYGQVTARQIATWLSDHGSLILSKNVRVVLADSEVNQALIETVLSSPDRFWYYNNGVTVLCERIEKAPAGGADRRVGTFSFSGASVVNGAQTAGSLERALAMGRTSELDTARVMVRFVSLEGSGDAFATDVTRATNTQNRIGGRDFVSLDPEQRRIRDEFAVEGLEYVYRSGESDPNPDKGCGIVQATVALACAKSEALPLRQSARSVDSGMTLDVHPISNSSILQLVTYVCGDVYR